MEVCGGQTHGLLRYGIDRRLEGRRAADPRAGLPRVRDAAGGDRRGDRSGPAGPTSLLTSFGDMLRVPGSRESLLQARASGANVAHRLLAARRGRDRPGSIRDATSCSSRSASKRPRQPPRWRCGRAAELDLDNFSLLVAHVRVQPAMEIIAGQPDGRSKASSRRGTSAPWRGTRAIKTSSDCSIFRSSSPGLSLSTC